MFLVSACSCLCNLLKPGVKSRMKVWLEYPGKAMLQLHLSDRQFCCLLRWDLYYRFDGTSLFRKCFALFLMFVKFVPYGPIQKKPALDQVMTRRQKGAKPLPNQSWSKSFTHTCRHASMGNVKHDDVIKWKNFPRHWPFVMGIQKGQWRGTLIFCLICAWTNSWANNRDAGDFKRHGAHYDVTVMRAQKCWEWFGSSTFYLQFQLL